MTAEPTELKLTETVEGVTLPVRVVPRAGRNQLDGVVAGALRVRLTAPPVEGAANEALVRLLAELVGVAKREVVILSGERGRQKVVLLRGVTAEVIIRRLNSALGAHPLRRVPATKSPSGD